MDFTDNILIAIPTIIIALSSLVVVWSQRVDSRQQALIGAITLLINLKDKEVSTLSTLMETASRPDLIKNLPDKARKNAFLDAKKNT